MKTQDIESAHQYSLEQLIQEFGPDKEILIRVTYEAHRRELERDARVHLFIPILACNATRQALSDTEDRVAA